VDSSVDDPADDDLDADLEAETGSTDEPSYRTERYVNTDQVPTVDELMQQAARSAGIGTTAAHESGEPSSEPSSDRTVEAASQPEGGGRGDEAMDLHLDDDDDERKRHFWQRRPKTTIAVVVVIALLAYPAGAYVAALRKPGTESFSARTAEWARDMKLGFAVDWMEQRQFATDQFAQGGSPDATAFSAPEGQATTTVGTAPPVTVPHTPPPSRMASPVNPPDPLEGVWTPIGPQPKGLPGVYVTKVRPDTTHTSLTLFAAWIDPKLTDIVLHPGTDLPGGSGWATPHQLDPCANAIMASNGFFRMDQARGGYYSEGREPFALQNGAASLVLYKDGTVDVVQWGREIGRDQLPTIASVRQNLQLLVDNGQPTASTTGDTDWGAKLPNVYFMWRSGYGVTADGALVYVGGPALTPNDLAKALVNAGAVKAMEGDINPEWVTAILVSNDAAGCHGQKALGGPENTGGMRAPDNRYLQTDTRDFIGVYAKQ
jgi:hypothetical protein